MANQWLRLWHDMPTNPKWRTISRISEQPIALVQAIFLHLLVNASRNVTRGHIDVTNEDLASALDVTEEQIDKIILAMQGRVLEGKKLSGWDKRQPKKEDQGSIETFAKSASQRKREQREREKLKGNVTNCHEMSHDVTIDKDKEEDKDLTQKTLSNESVKKNANAKNDKCPHFEIIALYHELLPASPRVNLDDWKGDRRTWLKTRWSENPTRQSLDFWREFFTNVAASDFLCGRKAGSSGTPFIASLSWLIRPRNFIKVLEGEYENRSPPQNNTDDTDDPLEKIFAEREIKRKLHEEQEDERRKKLEICNKETDEYLRQYSV